MAKRLTHSTDEARPPLRRVLLNIDHAKGGIWPMYR